MKRTTVIINLLIVLFAAPGIIAYLVYSHPEWVSAPTTNHGHLLQPPPKLDALSRGEKWQLLYWSPQPCAQACVQRIDELAKLRLALGRRLYYVDLVLASHASLIDVSQETQDLLHTVDGKIVQLTREDAEKLGVQPAIYLVNPQHYVVLAYSSDQAAKDIFQDLQKMVHDK